MLNMLDDDEDLVAEIWERIGPLTRGYTGTDNNFRFPSNSDVEGESEDGSISPDPYRPRLDILVALEQCVRVYNPASVESSPAPCISVLRECQRERPTKMELPAPHDEFVEWLIGRYAARHLFN